MPQQTIDIGTVANDGTGDPIRDAFDKCNDNFTELYTGLTGLLDFKGSTDCSANPNYPAASKGDFYIVSVAGKIGGASGIVVEIGDAYFATADNAGGTQAGVGTSWSVIQANIVGSAIAELDDIPDVNAPSPSNGDVLTWDSTPGEWVASAPTGGSNALDDLTDVNAPAPSNGDVLTWDSTPGEWVASAPSGGTSTILIGFEIDGGGSTITTGFKGYSAKVPPAHTITKVTALSVDTAGPATSCSITVDVWNDVIGSYPPTSADKISASAPVTLSSATNSEDSTLTGWDTSTPANSIYGFEVITVTGAKKVLILIEATV